MLYSAPGQTGGSISMQFSRLGPDEAGWRKIRKLDIAWSPSQGTRVLATTEAGVRMYQHNAWGAGVNNTTDCFILGLDCYFFRDALFSPFNDTLILTAAQVSTQGEPGSMLETRSASTFLSVGVPLPAVPFMGPGAYAAMIGDGEALYRLSFRIERSTNGGITWVNHTNDHGLYLGVWQMARVSRAPYLFAYTSFGPGAPSAVGRSNDSGFTWHDSHIIEDHLESGTIVASGDTVYLATSAGPDSLNASCGLVRSTDAGNTWERLVSGKNFISLALGPSPSTVYAAGLDTLFRSSDGGSSWQSIFVLPYSAIATIAVHPRGDTLYIGTKDTGIVSIWGSTVGVRDEEAAAELDPDGWKLASGYPNPFNGQVNFEVENSRSDILRLAIFDLLGREVAVLFDGPATPGIRTLTWDASFMPSGAYVVRMQVGGKVSSRRVVLAK